MSASEAVDELRAWFTARLPAEWFDGAVEIVLDREEISVVGRLATPEPPQDAPGAPATSDAETSGGGCATGGGARPKAHQNATQEGRQQAAQEGGEEGQQNVRQEGRQQIHERIHRFRADTRERRVSIAREAEHRFGRKVSWGVECAGTRQMFTILSVPVMTRLRQPERRVLDTLVEAGVARSRSDALGWCVRLVGKNADEWLAELREALQHVERARAAGPQV